MLDGHNFYKYIISASGKKLYGLGCDAMVYRVSRINVDAESSSFAARDSINAWRRLSQPKFAKPEAKRLITAGYWSGRRESNPHMQLGKLHVFQ
jgi:hypothetical protein